VRLEVTEDPKPITDPERIQEIIARYFEIDLNKIEEEKRAILEEQRRLNAADTEWTDETPPGMQ
jgi:hypothetical protein